MDTFVCRLFQKLSANLPARRSPQRSVSIAAQPLEIRQLLSAVIAVNATSDVHAIDPNIYGSAFATTAQLADLNMTVNREGGNNASTYNWQADASNHDNDWFFESIASGTGNGQSMDAFVSQTQAGGAQPDLTIPIMPYVASLGPNGSDLGSYPVSIYGAQQYTDPYNSNFGNGVTVDGQNITDTNPLYNYVANSPAFEQGWIQHLLSTFGTPGNGGVQYFTLGNEPGLWNSTNRDIHPNGETNTELLNDIISYGSMIKSIDPNALILGPEEWGWTNYFVDGADAASGNYGATYFDTATQQYDLNAQQWLLQQLAQYQAQHGTRLLDYYTLHYYPQEAVNGDNNGGVDSNNVDQATELLRNQVTRSLWDPNYVDPSWIASTGINGGIVDLIPTMKNWVNTYYPGTKTGITEYNFGAEGDMNGATTQADLYGIFGQQGLDLATRWTTPATGTPTYEAMKLWRNYDGNDSGFGNTSVGTSVANPDQTDAFSAIRSSDGALTVAVINKNLYDSSNPTATTSITVNLSGFASNGVAQEWQLAAVNPSDQTNAAITHLTDVHFSGNSFTINVPMESVTMFVLKPATSLMVTTNPMSQTVGAGNNASFSAAASGSPTPTVQWQVKTNGGTTFSNVSGATSTTFSFTASVGQSGNQYRAVFTNSSGNVTTSAATLTVDVPPSVSAPTTGSLVENTSLTFSTGNSNAISIVDPAATASSDTVKLTVTHGKLTLGSTTGITFSSGTNGSATMTFYGTVANLNAALSALVFTPTAGYAGADSLALVLTNYHDTLTATANVALTVTAPLQVTAPTAANTTINNTVTFLTANSNAITILDPAATASSDTVKLSVTYGKLTLGSITGLTFSSGSNGSATMTFYGTVANLNAALNGLTYIPSAGYSGSDTLAITLKDYHDNLSTSANVAITGAIPQPSVTAPSAGSVAENASLTFSAANSNAISIADLVATAGSDTVKLTVTHGKLTLGATTGLTFSSGTNGSATMTFFGTIANLNAALNGLTYTPTKGYTGSDTLSITLKNGRDNLTASASVALTVTAPPSPHIARG